MQGRYPSPVALGLKDNCIYLPRHGTLRSYAKTAELFRSASANPELMDGRMLALHHVNGPDDVHYPVWEMHPAGDELLILVSGSLSVDFREGDTERTAPLPPQAALIVPAGIWHRFVVHGPSVLITIAPRHNTAHKED